MQFLGLCLASIIVFSVVGMQEIFAESSEFDWYVGKDLDEKDYFKFELCHITYKNCQPFEIHLWVKPRYNATEIWSFEILVIDDNQKIRGAIEMDENNTSSLNVSNRITQFGKILGQFFSDSNFYVRELKINDKLVTTTLNNTEVLIIDTSNKNQNGYILISSQLPFPSQRNESYNESVYSKQGLRGEKIVEIELITAKKDHIPDFLMYDSKIDKNSILEHATRVLILPNNTNTMQLPLPLIDLVKGIWIYLSPGVTNAVLEFNSATSSESGGWFTPIVSSAKPTSINFEKKLHISNVELTYDGVCCDAYVHMGYFYQDLDEVKSDFPDNYLEPPINSLRPLHQVNAGVKPTDIFCKPWMVLIFKSSDNAPTCVKPSTAEILIERGWT